MKMVAEGVHTTVAARRSPGPSRGDAISEQIYQLLYRGKPVEAAVAELMSRALKAEIAADEREGGTGCVRKPWPS